MKHGWEIKKLGEVTTFINGDRGKNYPSQNDFVKEGIPFINAGHLVDGCVDFSSMNYISEEKYEKLGSGKIWNGDLLFCLRGSLGKKAIVENLDKAAIASSLVIIRCIDIFNRYLYYYLDSPIVEDLIFQCNNGSSQPNLSAKSVASFPIPVPPLSVQSSIVSELDGINGILEKKREQLKELDALAQSIFYDMFGDPIQNEKGWEVKKWNDLFDTILGKMLDKKKQSDSDILLPYLANPNVLWGNFSLNDLREMTFSDKERKKLKLEVGDLLICEGGESGRCAVWKGSSEEILFQKAIHRARIKKQEQIEPLFASIVLKELKKNGGLKNYISKSTIEHLTGEKLNLIPIILPPLPLQQAFAAKIEAIEKQKELVKRSIAEVETLLASRMQHYFEA